MANQISGNAEKTRVAVYARFSCDKQRDASIEDQIYEAERYCESHGYEIVKLYTDYAMSGRSDDRPQFLTMIDDAQAGAFDVVLVWKMDRFARNMQDQFYHEKILSDAGVRLESVKENISGNGIEASMSKGMHAIFAQIRSQQSAEDTMRGMIGKARKCQYLGYHWLGYTHDGDTIIIDTETKDLARGVHEQYLAGESVKEIVRWLNEQGVKNRNGQPVTYSFVTGILKNWAYAGVYTWGKAKDEQGRDLLDIDGQPVPLVRIEDGIPAIVTVDEKEACLQRLRFKKHVNIRSDYMLSGKLYCGKCGKLMHGETCRNSAGKHYFRYCCPKKRKACTGVYWKEELETAIASVVRSMLHETDVLECIADAYAKYRNGKKPKAAIEAAQADLKAIKKQRDNLIKAVQDGLPYKHVAEKLNKLDREQERLERKIVELNRKQDSVSREEVMLMLTDVANGYRTDSEILKAFISQVWVYGDEALAVMNFEGKTSTPYEINQAYKRHEHAAQAACSCDVKMVHQTRKKTNEAPLLHTAAGVRVILLENGLGIVVTLKAA